MSSISIALAAWLNTASAALTRVDGGVARSTMTFSKVVAAAVEPCCRREIDSPIRLASRGAIVLTPTVQDGRKLYRVSGNVNLLPDVESGMLLVARDGIEPPTPAFSGLPDQ